VQSAQGSDQAVLQAQARPSYTLPATRTSGRLRVSLVLCHCSLHRINHGLNYFPAQVPPQLLARFAAGVVVALHHFGKMLQGFCLHTATNGATRRRFSNAFPAKGY
jgi:hypothetical protein